MSIADHILIGMRVKVSKYHQTPGENYCHMVSNGEGTFQGWGVDFQQGPDGSIGNFTTAIVLRDNGKVENQPVELIQFIEDERFSDPDLIPV